MVKIVGTDRRHLKLIGVRSKRFLVAWNAGLYESELDTLANVWQIKLATSKGDEYKAVEVSNIGMLNSRERPFASLTLLHNCWLEVDDVIEDTYLIQDSLLH
ncbi:hypothetical protein TNCV_3155721 [Trichonephila clavipes]|nr:hypothetical protein TNCV_3155721 [Trichonephila clavipes]